MMESTALTFRIHPHRRQSWLLAAALLTPGLSFGCSPETGQEPTRVVKNETGKWPALPEVANPQIPAPKDTELQAPLAGQDSERAKNWSRLTLHVLGTHMKEGSPCNAPALNGYRCFDVSWSFPTYLSFKIGAQPKDQLDGRDSIQVTLSPDEWRLSIRRGGWFFWPTQKWMWVPMTIARLDDGARGAALQILSRFGFTSGMIRFCESIIESKQNVPAGNSSDTPNQKTFSCVNRPAWRGDPGQFEFIVRNPFAVSTLSLAPRHQSEGDGLQDFFDTRYAYVAAKTLTVRDAPRNGSVLGQVGCGTEVYALNRSHRGWTAIRTRRWSRGYVLSQHLSPRPPAFEECQP